MSTLLFRTVSRYGHSVTEKRAHKKDPALAERRRARDKGHYIAASEGPGGLDGYFEDMKIEQSYRPLWLRGVMQIHWWAERHGIRPTCRNIKYFWQRGKRVYSDRDLWSFDHFLATTIRDGVRDLNTIKHGWPGDPLTFEDWGKILDEISDGMQAHLDLGNLDYDWKDINAEAALQERRDLGITHLAKYFGYLWD